MNTEQSRPMSKQNTLNCRWKGYPPDKELLEYIYTLYMENSCAFESSEELIRHFYESQLDEEYFAQW